MDHDEKISDCHSDCRSKVILYNAIISRDWIEETKLESINPGIIWLLSYKVQCFMEISGTGKTDNLTSEFIQDNFPCENHRFSNNQTIIA